MPSIVVMGNVRGAFVSIAGSVARVPVSLGALTIGGSPLGGAASISGAVNVAGDIGPVSIGGDLKGGSGQNSGPVHTANGDIGGVPVRGSVLGGSQNLAGASPHPPIPAAAETSAR